MVDTRRWIPLLLGGASEETAVVRPQLEDVRLEDEQGVRAREEPMDDRAERQRVRSGIGGTQVSGVEVRVECPFDPPECRLGGYPGGPIAGRPAEPGEGAPEVGLRRDCPWGVVGRESRRTRRRVRGHAGEQQHDEQGSEHPARGRVRRCDE